MPDCFHPTVSVIPDGDPVGSNTVLRMVQKTLVDSSSGSLWDFEVLVTPILTAAIRVTVCHHLNTRDYVAM